MIGLSPASARAARTVAAAICLAGSFPECLHAQLSPGAPDLHATDTVTVGATTGQNSKGVVSINIASGSNNQQLRSLIIANGANAFANGLASQSITFSSGDASGFLAVEQGVFKDATGAMSLNVAAGDANQQANLALIAIGISGISVNDAVLSQTRAATPPGQGAPKPSSTNTAEVPSDAFGGAQGLVQINLTAGNRNSSANVFALTAAGGSM